MTIENFLIEALPGICVGIAAIIPVVAKLINTIKLYASNKQYDKLVGIVADYMAQAEDLLANGADKKQWVMSMAQASASEIGIEFNAKAIGDMIDKLCELKYIDKSIGKKAK